MQVFARLRVCGDRLVDAVPGDLVGRLPTAAVRINDPRISEAHALVSLRSRNLRLLALRGRFAVRGEVASDVALTPGLTIQLAPRIELAVVAVSITGGVLAIEGANLPSQVLPPVASLDARTGLLTPGFEPDAAALLWTAGRSLHLRRPGHEDVALVLGSTFELPGQDGPIIYRVLSLPVDAADTDPTERGDDVDRPLAIILRYDTVHVHRGDVTVAIDGLPARMVCELALMGVPVEWRTLARVLWPDQETEDAALRSRFDRVMTRLRRSLREAGLRPDLVRNDGSGRVELKLGPRDRLEDRT